VRSLSSPFLRNITAFRKSGPSVSSGAANDSASTGGRERAGVRGFHSISDLLLNLDANLCRLLLFEVLPSLSPASIPRAVPPPSSSRP